MIRRFKIWNKWRKGCLNGPFHKFFVLIGLVHSPTFRVFQMFDEWTMEDYSMESHGCYDCAWECLDGCCLKLDDNGNREPVYDIPTDCKDFEERTERNA